MVDLHQYRRVLKHYAHNYPKSSVLAMFAATGLTCATFVVAVSARDERAARLHYQKMASLTSEQHSLTQTEAQVAAMIENAKRSTWRENLENAVDAHDKFMLPHLHSDGSEPQFVKNIDERSREMLEEEEKRKMEREDPKRTKFWR